MQIMGIILTLVGFYVVLLYLLSKEMKALRIINNNSGFISFGMSNKNDCAVITSSSKLGIGTTNPLASLDIRNNQNMVVQGRIGIGTTNPLFPLDIRNGGVGIAGNLNLNNTNISNALTINTQTIRTSNITIKTNSSQFVSTQWSNINNNIYFLQGNVGIGTTNPLTSLDIRGITHVSGFIGIGTTNPKSSIHLQNTGNQQVSILINDSTNGSCSISKDNKQELKILNTYNNGDIILGVTNNSNALLISPSGNIGIGITNPLSILDIRNNNIIGCCNKITTVCVLPGRRPFFVKSSMYVILLPTCTILFSTIT